MEAVPQKTRLGLGWEQGLDRKGKERVDLMQMSVEPAGKGAGGMIKSLV